MSHRIFIAVAAVTLGLSGPVAAQTGLPEDWTATVGLAVDRGELLYIYDQAAWHGTDDFLAKYSSLQGNAGGYVVSGDQNQTELAFYDKAKLKAVYRATFTAGKLTKSGPPAPERIDLSPLEKQLIWAKETGLNAFMEAKVGLCNNASPNLAALPPERAGGPFIVYLMTSQTDMKTYPLGGHFSVQVGQDGSVSKIRRFTKSCIDMPMGKAPSGSEPAAFFVTHLLDPTPTEIHVFTSIATKTPIYVGTSEAQAWAVDGNSVRLVDLKK